MQLNAQQLEDLLAVTIPACLPVLITGAPGIGKTDIVKKAAKRCGAALLISHPAVSDPTDFKGLPWFEKGAKHADFKPFGDFATALEAPSLLAWFHDDLGQASNAVQAADMQLFLGRRVNSHVLPNHVCMIAATNRRIDRAGVSGLLEPLKSRFTCIVELVPDIKSWSNWAFSHAIPASLIAFLKFRPDLLSDFKPTADLTNSPMPRTWAALAKLEALNLPTAIEAATMAGAVGEGAANEYLAFRRLINNLPNIDAILLDPAKAAIPTAPNELYATVVGLAARANATTFARIATYVTRLVDKGKGEFGALCVRDSLRRDKTLQNSQTFATMLAGPMGQLISGNAN